MGAHAARARLPAAALLPLVLLASSPSRSSSAAAAPAEQATVASSGAAGLGPAAPAPNCSAAFGNPLYDVASMFGGSSAPPIALPAATLICKPYEAGSCCTSTYTSDLATKGVSYLYPGYSFSMCPIDAPAANKTVMSAACQAYMNAQECSYGCDPWLNAPYTSSATPPPSIGLCSTYCDDWFAACANDYTCVQNWNTWPMNTSTGVYFCPLGSTCQTFAQLYGNGRGLCEQQWAPVYHYETNLANCSTLQWWGAANPNAPTPTPVPAVTCVSGAVGVGSSAWVAALASLAVSAGLLRA